MDNGDQQVVLTLEAWADAEVKPSGNEEKE